MDEQQRLGRRHAPPLVPAKAGFPLIRSVPSLGWQPVRIKATIDVEADLEGKTKMKKVYWAAKRFVEWMEKEGHKYQGGMTLHGPFPHMDFKQPDIQVGDRGATRKVARSIEEDLSNNGKEDYVWEAVFLTRERIQEIPADVAMEVNGKRGIRLMREGTANAGS